MTLLDALGEYLSHLDRSQGEDSTQPHAPEVDAALVRTLFIRSLERLDYSPKLLVVVAPPSPRSQFLGPPKTREDIFHDWQANDAIIRFAQRLTQLLHQSFGKGASRTEIEQCLEVAIARRLGLPAALSSPIRTLELDRLAGIAFKELGRDTPSWVSAKLDGYAAAIRATRRVEGRLSLTPIGRVFLDLSGRDAIRWLLHVEVAQSTGPADSWRLSREEAHALLKTPAFVVRDQQLLQPLPSPLSWPTLQRLAAMELVAITSDSEEGQIGINTLPLGQTLLSEIEKDVETPMSILAGSLIADLTLAAAEAVARPTNEDSSGARANAAAEATARQARMVAHEIRNTLVPVKTALGALYREVLLEPPSEVLIRRRERIDRGIDSTFRFIEQLVQLSKLAATPPEAFDLLPAIQDALASIEQESGHRIEFSLPDALPPVSGHRARVVMALANVLRNASQAVPQQDPIIRIRAEAIDAARAVLVTVEDNGPGVPANMRRAIFDEGTSLRAGGSGLGLALVREVFEKEIRGLVACDASPLGGARFTIRIPVTGVERP